MESNHRPPLYKSGALTAEPWERLFLSYLYIALEVLERKIRGAYLIMFFSFISNLFKYSWLTVSSSPVISA